MPEEIWSWDDIEQKLKLARERLDDQSKITADMVEEAARWRRMYEQQRLMNAILQGELDALKFKVSK